MSVLKPVGTGGKKTVLENSHAWGHMVTEDIPQHGEIILRVWTLHLGATPAPPPSHSHFKEEGVADAHPQIKYSTCKVQGWRVQ